MNATDKTDKRPGVVMYPDGGLYRLGENKFQCDGWGRNRKVFVSGLDIMDVRDCGYISLGAVNTKGWRSPSIRIEIPADPDTLDAIAKEFSRLAGDIRRKKCDRLYSAATRDEEENPYFRQDHEIDR